VKPFAMRVELENVAAVGALPLEHRRGIMKCVREDVHLRLAPGHQLAVEPDEAVAVVVGLIICHAVRLGQAVRLVKFTEN